MAAKEEKHLVTVLSIDGGGIRGIIPAIILGFLESELQVMCLGFMFWLGYVKISLYINFILSLLIEKTINLWISFL